MFKIFDLPNKPANCARSIFKMNGRESSIVFVSEENLFNIRPSGVMSKK